MLARVHTCAITGLDGVIVEVEVDYTQGFPGMTVVGLPDAAVQESRERVQAAVRNAGVTFPRKRLVVNLAPASVRKEGPSYDLPIALGVLIYTGMLPTGIADGMLVVGELSLDGSVRHTRGVLPMAATARQNGFQRIVVPSVDAAEAALIPGLEVIPVDSLAQLYAHLCGRQVIPLFEHVELASEPPIFPTDFSEIKGQEHVKRALEVAAAGGHNVLMIGPPGAGKTLLARALPGILPDMSIEEALDVTRIYSVADQLPPGIPLIRHRPYRSPHHTISHAGLVGGGNWPHPGEISLAHRGVLFLDELPEFGMRVLEVLRQPMEDKLVTISRAQGSLTFPANFQLIAAMNPCPCGYYGDPVKPCTCSNMIITKYQKRISGPLLDRIDIHIEVPRVEYEKLSDTRFGESSSTVRARIESARLHQRERFSGVQRLQSLPNEIGEQSLQPLPGDAGEQGLQALPGDAGVQSPQALPGDGGVQSLQTLPHSTSTCNADMRPAEVRKYCQLDETGQSLMKSAMNQLQLSARAYHRVLKLARTIADLAGSESIQPPHLAEALQYRPRLGMMG